MLNFLNTKLFHGPIVFFFKKRIFSFSLLGHSTVAHGHSTHIFRLMNFKIVDEIFLLFLFFF